VRCLSFVYGCPTSNVAKGMTALVEAIKLLCFTMKIHKENPARSILIEHLKEYHQGLYSHLTKDCDKVINGKQLTIDLDSHFNGGYSIHYHKRLNCFMVDYDIVCILKNCVGYSSWDDVPLKQKELCYKDYNSKMHSPNCNGDEEQYSG
jgi:hypothetical protein